MRLIDADALIERIKYSFDEDETVNIGTVTETFLDKVCSPTVDAISNVHAHWNKFGNNIWECSNCCETIPVRRYMEEHMFYCNCCGAKMDGVVE